jgi:hypothetical protein
LGLNYKQRDDPEGKNNNTIITDIIADKPVRLINIYSSHSPQENINQRTKLQAQPKIITDSVAHNLIIQGTSS